jgi:hypothetical protein
MQKARASMPHSNSRRAGTAIVGGPGFGPPASILQQQQRRKWCAKMQQTQESVFRRNLSEEEYAIVAKAMHGNAIAEARHRLQGRR